MRQCAAYRLIGLRFLAVALSLVMPAACDSGEGSRHGAVPGASTDGAAASPDDAGRRGPAAGAKTMPATGGVTGDPDHDFVRMMSDHHKGLIVLAHMTKERADVGAAKADAVTLDREQDRELDMMKTMLEKTFKDPYSPSVAPEHRAMAEALQGKRGVEYARTFYRTSSPITAKRSR